MLTLLRDLQSRYVSDADEAINIGSVVNAKINPFLDIKLLVETAVSTGAHAIHPGYGYLNENPAFAEAVRHAGLIFIGPTATAMSTLGDKRSSKDYLRKHAPEVTSDPGVRRLEPECRRLGSGCRTNWFPSHAQGVSRGRLQRDKDYP
jgi:acetyl/propionyl-CoA carboxylase alpha subunit